MDTPVFLISALRYITVKKIDETPDKYFIGIHNLSLQHQESMETVFEINRWQNILKKLQ